jgi:hypothetical protein
VSEIHAGYVRDISTDTEPYMHLPVCECGWEGEPFNHWVEPLSAHNQWMAHLGLTWHGEVDR